MMLAILTFRSDYVKMLRPCGVLIFLLSLTVISALKKCDTTPYISQPPISWKKGNVIVVALLKAG